MHLEILVLTGAYREAIKFAEQKKYILNKWIIHRARAVTAAIAQRILEDEKYSGTWVRGV